jgi:hypothetical protein
VFSEMFELTEREENVEATQGEGPDRGNSRSFISTPVDQNFDQDACMGAAAKRLTCTYVMEDS